MCCAALGSTGEAAAKLRCRPMISGTLWWLDETCAKWNVDQWREELEKQRKIGFDLIWFLNAGPSLNLPGNTVQQMMDLCAKRRVQVVLDAGSTGQWWTPFDVENELKVCGENIRKIGEQFKGHPAFYGWYIAQEIYVAEGEMGRKVEDLYRGLVERFKKAADLPVTISPFFWLDKEKIFGEFSYATPEDYRHYWTRLIRKTGIDIVMPQDSGEHFSYVTMEQRRPFLAAMSAACRDVGIRMWGNVESAEVVCESKEEYVRKYGKVHPGEIKDPPWRPVPIDRLRQKLELAAEYSERIVNWGYREFCRPELGEDAAEWYEDYLKYYREVKAYR